MPTDLFAPVLDAIDAHLRQGDARAAVKALRQCAGYPQLIEEGDWPHLAGALCRIAAEDVPDLARAAARLQRTPADVQALYDVGYQLFEVGLFELAAAVFSRAEALSPGMAPVVSELCATLEELGCYADAVRLLQAHPQLARESLLFAYLLAFSAVLSGQLSLARAQLPLLAHPSDAREVFMVARIRRMLARADFLHPAAAALDGQDLRGWHAVLSGGVLLHLSPHGFAEPMHGRYAFIQDSLPRIRAGIQQLQAALSLFSVQPTRVLLMPERGSEALGRATARLLGLPTAPFAVDAAGLVVVYDLADLPHPAQVALRQHRPNQHLWAHATYWTTPPICAPDVTTLLYQHCQAPWTPSPLDTGPPEVEGGAEAIAEALLAVDPAAAEAACAEDARPQEGASLWAHLAGATDEAEAALRREEGLRERLWFMGPVSSSRFT